MNRKNITIVALTFVCASVIAWLIGYAIYSSPGREEAYYQQQYFEFNSIYESNKTARQKKQADYEQYANNRDNPPELRHVAFDNAIALGETDIQEEKELLGWLVKMNGETTLRSASRHHYNLAAIVLLGISALFGLLLFITSPTKPTSLVVHK